MSIESGISGLGVEYYVKTLKDSIIAPLGVTCRIGQILSYFWSVSLTLRDLPLILLTLTILWLDLHIVRPRLHGCILINMGTRVADTSVPHRRRSSPETEMDRVVNFRPIRVGSLAPETNLHCEVLYKLWWGLSTEKQCKRNCFPFFFQIRRPKRLTCLHLSCVVRTLYQTTRWRLQDNRHFRMKSIRQQFMQFF